MSMYQAKDSLVLDNQLEVQVVNLRTSDPALLVANGGGYVFIVNEPVAEAMCAVKTPAAGGNCVASAKSNVTIVDSVAFTSGGDMKAISVASLTMAANDIIEIKYRTQK